MHRSTHTIINTFAHPCKLISDHSQLLAHHSAPRHARFHLHAVPDPWPGTPIHTHTLAAHTFTYRFPCTDSNTQMATSSSTHRFSCPPPTLFHWDSSIMGSRKTFENHPAITLFQGKLGVGGKFIKFGRVASLGKLCQRRKKKEPSSDDGKPSSEQGIMGVSRDHLAAFINPRVYFLPLPPDKVTGD